MLDYISSMEQLEKDSLEIQAFLDITCSEDANEAVYRGNKITFYMARSSKMLADAKYHRDMAREDLRLKINESLAPSVLKLFIESATQRENYLVNWIERLNSTCSHQLDWLRTVISKAKAEYTKGMNQ